MDMEPASPVVSRYLPVFRDCLQGAWSKTSPREIGTVLRKWIEWHDSIEAQGTIRFRGAIGSKSHRIRGQFSAERYRVQTESTDPIVGYLLIGAVNFDEATEIAASCPALDHGFAVDVCEPFTTAQISDLNATNES